MYWRILHKGLSGREFKTDIKEIRSDVDILKTEVKGIRTDVDILKVDVNVLKDDTAELKAGKKCIDEKLNSTHEQV